MKKIIAILGISLFTMALFTNSNVLKNNQSLDLASLTTLNVADAECHRAWNQDANNGKCNWLGTRCYSQVEDLPDNDC